MTGSNSALTELLHHYCTGNPTELVIQTSWKKEYISMFLFKITVKDYGYLCFMERKKVKYWRTRFADLYLRIPFAQIISLAQL